MLQAFRLNKLDKQILVSLVLKGTSIIINFLIVPLSINALNTESYGLWLTITSIFGWFTFMDFGLTNGLVVNLSQSLGRKEIDRGRIMNSTVYISLFILSALLLILFLGVNFFLNWNTILNTQELTNGSLRLITLIVFTGFIVTFFLKPIESVALANQKPGISSAFNPVSNFIVLLILWLSIIFNYGMNLTYFCLIYAIATPAIYFILSIGLYKNEFSFLRPRMSLFDKIEFKSIFKLGWNFFLIQISLIILFQTSNLLIVQFWGAAEVTSYNLVYKYFSVIYMLFTILISPYMVVHGSAYSTDNREDIRKNMRKTFKIWLCILSVGIILLIFYRLFFRIWVGEKLVPDFRMAILAFLYFTLITFGGVFNMFINGTGKIKLQTISNLISALIYIPFTWILVKIFGIGLEGIFLSMILVNFYHPIIAPVQYYKLIHHKARGIWNK
jgi:O-antigen/teichoic acid export membrane protein